MSKILVKEMWPNGPLREFSETHPKGRWLAYATGGFVGQYICSKCARRASKGLVGPRYQCGPCYARFLSKMTGREKAPLQVIENKAA
jgi:DNA-directed RNA polymerase subunit RPC12/RpoP